MPTDPRKLRPSELCRLLNSTPLGEVLSERQLYRHRTRAGNRIGDGRYVDLLKYTAWLIEEKHRPRPETEVDVCRSLDVTANAELPARSQHHRSGRAATNRERRNMERDRLFLVVQKHGGSAQAACGRLRRACTMVARCLREACGRHFFRFSKEVDR